MFPDGVELFYPIVPSKDVASNNDARLSLPSLSQVGGKAWSLIQATSVGFPIPRGFVLTVAYFAPWVEKLQKHSTWKTITAKAQHNCHISKEDCDELKDLCRRLFLDGDEGDVILQTATGQIFGSVHQNADNVLVAVRSSSPEEDLAGSSFAGGYETTLGVPLLDTKAVQMAIVESFASVLDYRVIQYKWTMQRLRANDDSISRSVFQPRIAVVVQEQLYCSTSGVAFSMNPSNNCYDEVIITANFGLGESVVRGIVNPDVYVVLNNNPETKVVDNQFFQILDKKIGDKKESIWLSSQRQQSGQGGSGIVQTINVDNAKQALLDTQILVVANLVVRVEQAYKELQQSSLCPVDIEWAYHAKDDKLYLLQARPVTTHIPLFPEMLTLRGSPRRNLYLDVIVMSQGFNEPFSVLGLDIWKTFVALVKPQFSSDGPEGVTWNLHGREYLHISNYLKTIGGRKMIEKAFMQYDPALGRAIGTVDLDDYTPIEFPSGASGLLWKQIKQIGHAIFAMIWGLYLQDKAMDEYMEFVKELMNRYSEENDTECASDFEDLVMKGLSEWSDRAMFSMARIVAGYWSRYRLHKLFQGQDSADDLLVSLCMDLKGNPTSEMGHAMLQIASMPEIQRTETGEEFCKKLGESGTYSDEFMERYHDFMNRYGCRGMKEIDIASSRTSEHPAGLFQRLKEIDIDHNAVLNVSQRRREAHEKLLEIAKSMGKDGTFKYHDRIIQNLLGYRENPKYIYVFLVAMFRRHALKIGATFVSQGRLDKVEDIFNLTMSEISRAQKDNRMELRSLIGAHLKPYEEVQHVKTWPLLIDSRGKILREIRRDHSDDPNVLLGDPVAPGKIQGRAKILNTPYDKRLLSGEVLVARITEPSWTPIFINASAVIMEVGGPLQHGAIIAREYGIPCVSGLERATSLIHDGDWLEVDGSSGTVRFLRDKQEE